MTTLVLSFFSGINLAFFFVSFFISTKNKSQRTYLYFGLFSLFSGFYFLLLALMDLTEFNLVWGILFSAAVYYGVFPFFIFEIIGQRQNKVSWFLSLIFFFALLVYTISPTQDRYPLWQVIAHVGLFGLIATAAYASIVLLKKKEKGANALSGLTLIFAILALEEIVTTYTGEELFGRLTGDFLLLDVYPLLFTLIVGRKLSNDVYAKNKLKIQLMESDLIQQKLENEELRRKKLQDELYHKSKDLTDFGVEIALKKEFTQYSLNKLNELKNLNHGDSQELSDLIKYTRAQLQIDKDLAIFQKNADKINHEFLALLKNRYPNITENELHLASLLRLKLSSKEIATIKNITPDSVKVLRYRLRKKLNVPKNNSISNFLIDIN